jgi:hypothetical protein
LITGEALCYDKKGDQYKDFALAAAMGVSYKSRSKTGGDIAQRRAVIDHRLNGEKHNWPDSVSVKQFIQIESSQGETLLSLQQDEAISPLLHLVQYGQGRIGYLATSDDLTLMQAAIDTMMAAVPAVVTPAGEQVVLTYQKERKQWVLHILSEADLEINIDSRFADPEKIVQLYPVSGWTATSARHPRGMRVRVTGRVPDRLIMLR